MWEGMQSLGYWRQGEAGLPGLQHLCVCQLVKLRLNTQMVLVFTCSCMFFNQEFPCYFWGSI